VPGVQVGVVDSEGREVAPGEVGEIIARGPTSCAATGGAMRSRHLIDGWLHTGDLAMIDAERYIYLVDRKKT